MFVQIFLDECYNMKELMFQKELTLIKQEHQKNVCFFTIGIFKKLVINFVLEDQGVL